MLRAGAEVGILDLDVVLDRSSIALEYLHHRRHTQTNVLGPSAFWMGVVEPAAGIEDTQFIEGCVADHVGASGRPVQARIMNRDESAVGGEVEVVLDAIRAHLECEVVRGDRVLRSMPRRSAMSDVEHAARRPNTAARRAFFP